MNRIIQPGATLGVLGSGQLGRMFAMEARRLGYRVHVFSPADDTPTGHVADREVQAEYSDLDAVAEFAQDVDVVTFEFENVLAETTEVAERYAPVRPAGAVLHTTQHRLREKRFLRSAGVPVAEFQAIASIDDVQAVDDSMLPGVLKTAAWGYDGKGQQTVRTKEELADAWRSLDGAEAVLERFVDFKSELSVVAARGLDGEFASYEPIANTHENHILDLSVAPAGVPETVAREAREIARTIMTELQVVGVLCVEFFLLGDGGLLVNELAPRPHNSGHLTLDAHATSQFEQQVRAICGLPLGDTTLRRPAAMANLLGDLWSGGTPDWSGALAVDGVRLHLYGKNDARKGRKMGHLTAIAATPQEATEIALQARRALTAGQPSDGPANHNAAAARGSDKLQAK